MSKRILVIRFSSIGDILLTSPVVRALHQQLDAEVHFLTKPRFAELVSDNPYIERVHLLPARFADLASTLKTLNFHAVVDLHHNLRTWRLRAALPNPTWYRFDKLNWEKWLLVNWKIDRLPRVHIVDRYLATVAPLGVINDGRGLDFYWHPSVHVKHPVLQSSFYAVAMGAAHATKQIPLDRLAEALAPKSQSIVLLGGPKDIERSNALLEQLPNREIIDFCGKLSIQETAFVLQHAAHLLTPDTGLMHLGAALKIPMTTVWGNTVPAFGMTPYRPDDPSSFTIREVTGLACRPCSKIGFAKCPKGHFQCMREAEI